MDVTRDRISHFLELREILLSFQTGFNLVNAAVACAILDSISGLEPSGMHTLTYPVQLVSRTTTHQSPLLEGPSAAYDLLTTSFLWAEAMVNFKTSPTDM